MEIRYDINSASGVVFRQYYIGNQYFNENGELVGRNVDVSLFI